MHLFALPQVGGAAPGAAWGVLPCQHSGAAGTARWVALSVEHASLHSDYRLHLPLLQAWDPWVPADEGDARLDQEGAEEDAAEH